VNRTTLAAAAALAAGVAVAGTASPAAAGTTAPSPTAATWTVVHPTYQEQQPDISLPPPVASPTTPNPFGRRVAVEATAATRAPAPHRVEHHMAPWTTAPQRRLPQVTVHPAGAHRAAPPVHVRHHTAAKASANLLPPHRVHRPVVHHHIGRWTVVQGETLSGIARATRTTVHALMAANPQIADPNHVEAGWVLHIPAVHR
jgi:nucleoid-associated protein YgaU